MHLIASLVAMLCIAWSGAAHANIFDGAPTIVASRGVTANATLRLRYERTEERTGAAPQTTTVTIDVADTWALVQPGDQHAYLYDFSLNRGFELTAEGFRSHNLMAPLYFRVMERQNRWTLARAASAVGAANGADGCDAEAELGVIIPSLSDPAQTVFRRNGRAQVLTCNGREVGRYEDGQAATPAAFWPFMAHAMTAHPALLAQLRASGRAPAVLQRTVRTAPGVQATLRWRLVGSEQVDTPYPLTAAMANISANALDAIEAGLGALARDVVARRHGGGPPTLDTWNANLRAISTRDGEEAVGMEMLPTLNTFPQLQGCGQTLTHPLCDTISLGGRLARNSPPILLITMAMSEQQRNPAGALAAMRQLQAGRFGDHPAVAASFSLALLQFDDALRQQARAANLPTDSLPLTLRAVRAYPYTPAYWSDLADLHVARNDPNTAFLIFDVVFALPTEGSLTTHPAMRAKLELFERIRRDFPDFRLAG